jgi:hypothetical protein
MGCPDLAPICIPLVDPTVEGQRGCAAARRRHGDRAEIRAPSAVLRMSHEAAVLALLALKRRPFKRAVRPASGERSGADPGATRDVRSPCRLRQARRRRTGSVRDGSHPSVPQIRPQYVAAFELSTSGARSALPSPTPARARCWDCRSPRCASRQTRASHPSALRFE